MANVRHFGATGDGKTDDTQAIIHCLNKGDGVVHFPRGDYVISYPIEIPLDSVRRTAIEGAQGTAKIINTGQGPAFHFVGTHGGTAHPPSFKPNVWLNQRMPTVLNIEIEGRNAFADGIRFEGAMQAVVENVLLRELRHGVILTTRNRNVLINGCQIYHNRGVGILIDKCNLHQINITSSHVSYNALGGIRIQASEVRNLQITGNDIEYNNARTHPEIDMDEAPATAEIYIDTTAKGASVNEITVASNTIQATPSPNGANIRILENVDEVRGTARGEARRPGLWTITGNIIGSQHNNVHLTGCYGLVLSGNCIYSCIHRNLLVEHSSHVNVTGNHFRRHTPNKNMGVRFEHSNDCLFTGCNLHDEAEEGQSTGASPLELSNCRRMTITGCHITNGVPHGINIEKSTHLNITGNTILDTREEKRMKSPINWPDQDEASLVSNNLAK